MSTLMPLHDVLVELENAGHTELWMSSPRGRTCFEVHSLDQSQWYLPNIITRDGRTVAHREKRPNSWLLSGDWKNTHCQPGAAAPYDEEFLEDDWRFNLIARVKWRSAGFHYKGTNMADGIPCGYL